MNIEQIELSGNTMKSFLMGDKISNTEQISSFVTTYVSAYVEENVCKMIESEY